MKKFFVIFATLLFAVGGALILFLVYNANLAADDSSALYGGRPEYGYPSAGFLISIEENGRTKSCGYSALNNLTAITASHCVDGSSRIYLGTGEFSTNTYELVQAAKAVQKSGWITANRREDDFAVITLPTNSSLNSFSEVATPVEGCNYRIVAYGRTESQTSNDRPRKSALLCASNITAKTFTVKGSDSGICFGDSGSPLFVEGTNQVVGVMASVIKSDDSEVCSFLNTAIVVRADSNLELVNESIAEVNQVPVSAQDAIIIEVADDSLIQQLGLKNVEVFIRNKPEVLLVVAGIALLLIVIAVAISFRTPQQKNQLF